MSQTFTPRLDILPKPQQRLWPELSQLSASFTLYGGTAIALQLGHRVSVDFDFFALEPIDTGALYQNTSFLSGARIIQREANTLTCIVERDGPVKLSFFGLPNLKRINAPLRTSDTNLPVASLLDLAGTKAEVVQHRAAAKDYADIDALISAGIDLRTHLQAGRKVYGDVFVPIATVKALTYFDDGDLATLPPNVKARLAKAAADVDLLTLKQDGGHD
ncbi:nucleotidyl transferase AbiEii/AbiGii toxin family protein [Hyphomicrobium sp.]|uniref:nucleotidyl transferase AbiEii/AbiGii toxin family protein n=1 Tax=Hyphomicrobium sp. TaxID=82 RepID=UPI002E2F9A50|nr:nucleotidyl transferase AbiEii/AbiGii toxin family protein [Hyphomicrobium sp.]HEX2842163.1 nucleotidyl transferase AbiEii/AbiGii toxin family protein [Hyphomicrobium sp.]